MTHYHQQAIERDRPSTTPPLPEWFEDYLVSDWRKRLHDAVMLDIAAQPFISLVPPRTAPDTQDIAN